MTQAMTKLEHLIVLLGNNAHPKDIAAVALRALPELRLLVAEHQQMKEWLLRWGKCECDWISDDGGKSFHEPPEADCECGFITLRTSLGESK